MAYHSPFDLYYWFVQVFAGSKEIFFIIALIIIAMIAGTFRMASNVVAIMFGLFTVIFAIYTQQYYLLVIIATGLFLWWALTRFFK